LQVNLHKFFNNRVLFYRVAAENLAGCGLFSEPCDGVKACDPVKPPSKPGKPNIMEVNFKYFSFPYKYFPI